MEGFTNLSEAFEFERKFVRDIEDEKSWTNEEILYRFHLIEKAVKEFIKEVMRETDDLVLKNNDFKVNVDFAHESNKIIESLAGEGLLR